MRFNIDSGAKSSNPSLGRFLRNRIRIPKATRLEYNMAMNKQNDFPKYIIQKQRFHKSFGFPNATTSYKWPIKVNASSESDRLQQKVVEWDITVKFVQRGQEFFLEVEGEVVGSQFRLDKCFCRIDVLNKMNEIVTTHKENIKGPIYKFNFVNLFNLTELSKMYPNLYRQQADDKSTTGIPQTINATSFTFTFANPNVSQTTFSTGTTNTLSLTLTIGGSQKKNRSFKPMKRMLDEGILTDMVIKTKTEDFPCHKLILATYSEYFRTMFHANKKENRDNVVDWTDLFDSETVKDLLHFFYTGETPPNIRVTFPTLVEAAHLCLLDELKDICSEKLFEIINVDNAGSILEVAEKFELESLKENAIVFVGNHYDQVLDTRGFQNIQSEIKIRLLKQVFQILGKIIKTKNSK